MRVVWLCAVFALLACKTEDAETAPDAPPTCGLDCTDRPDAPPLPDAAPDAAPPGDDVVVTELTFAGLPDDAAALAAVEVADAERAGGMPYQAVTAAVSPSSIGPSTENRPGREAAIVLRWGHIPPDDPGPVKDWTRFDGSLAVSAGSIEVVRALRWEGTEGPGSPRPHEDFVAPQTDPRVIRFRSSIGSGSDGLLIRVVRPVIEPVVLVVKLDTFERALPFDEQITNRIVSGGFEVPTGNLQIDTYVPLMSDGCYAPDGTAELAVTYSGSGAIAEIHGTAMRGDVSEVVMLQADQLEGPFGNATGTIGDAGSTVSMYYARRFLFPAFEDQGLIVGRVNAANGSVSDFLVAGYEGSTVDLALFRRVPCSEPGAQHRNFFGL